VELKGVDLLLEALAGCGEVDVRLQIVGDGPSGDDLSAQARRLGIADRVDFLGWRQHDEMAALMREADVFVFPSLREAGGTVVLEGMACGLPVIVADWGGPAEMVDETVGIKVPVDDRDQLVAALRDAIVTLASDTELRVRLGRAGRDRIATTYDWSVLIDRLVQAYDSVLDSGTTGRSG
jgi:glycosyltransferase involved in cell wall biosynthesis